MNKLVTGSWLLKHILVLAVLVVLINLGLWQLRRLEERRTLNDNIMAALSQPALPLHGQPVDPETLDFRLAVVTGTFDNAAAIILRNQLYGDQSGWHLITPLRLKGSDQAVLVNRGWIPRGGADPEPSELTQYDASGEVTLEGIAYRSQTRRGWLSPVDPPLKAGQTRLVAWFRVDIDRIQEQLPYPLLPVFVKQLPDPQTKPDSFPRPEETTLNEGPHLGYAVQWFAIAGVLVITYGAFMRQELRRT
jgi:surfeit locus 1 family protein